MSRCDVAVQLQALLERKQFIRVQDRLTESTLGIHLKTAFALTAVFLLVGCAASPASVIYRPTEANIRMDDTEAEATLQRMVRGERVTGNCSACRLYLSTQGETPLTQGMHLISQVATERDGIAFRLDRGSVHRISYADLENLHVVHYTIFSLDHYGVWVRPDLTIGIQPSLDRNRSKELDRTRAFVLADALLALKLARGDEAEQKFAKALAYYLSASPKPAITEDMHRFVVQGVALIKQKRFSEAATLYNAALKQWPWWSDARYNRALILGELKRYQEAIQEMKRFMQLEPNSQVARAVLDQIYQWEVAAK